MSLEVVQYLPFLVFLEIYLIFRELFGDEKGVLIFIFMKRNNF